MSSPPASLPPMAAPGLPPLPPDIGRLVGPLLIGHLLNWCLFGVLSLQTYMYYLAFPNDPKHNRLLVFGVYLFEAVQTMLLTQSAFHAFAANFGNIVELDRIGTIWFSVPVMGGIVAFAVQSFYAYRISILAQSKIVATFIVFLSMVQLGGAIATGFESHKAVFNSQFLGKASFITVGIWNGGSALCDAIIAICMTVYLSRRNTGMKHTQVLLNKIIRLTIETGSASAVIAILTFALAILPGHPTYYQATVALLGKLYANSMLAVFNSRMGIRPDNNTSKHEVSTADPRSNISAVHHPIRSNAYEMHGGIAVTREEVSFPPPQTWGKGQPLDEESFDDKPRKL
ncbi:hypothetical protein GALMADRAFT_255379 [Galerina marginata CBS 339.88]|uniref:DUF6534 domain-containing protein n=1 Tax=Galerina marginata (strain CBS 339.88) TaxID=685588 RepID=A0A067STE5_GALM3|nr:hypothetical protein GALMADRAFT_255379 [Galerina marginata CBS 339.88]